VLAYCLEKVARADSTLFKCGTDMTHVFSVVFVYLLYVLAAKHLLSEEWNLRIMADGRKLEVAVGQGGEGGPGEAAGSGCNLEMWSIQSACTSLSC